jgi:hypothetical protein
MPVLACTMKIEASNDLCSEFINRHVPFNNLRHGYDPPVLQADMQVGGSRGATEAIVN